MSDSSDVLANHIEKCDVDERSEENAENKETSCDSGVECSGFSNDTSSASRKVDTTGNLELSTPLSTTEEPTVKSRSKEEETSSVGHLNCDSSLDTCGFTGPESESYPLATNTSVTPHSVNISNIKTEMENKSDDFSPVSMSPTTNSDISSLSSNEKNVLVPKETKEFVTNKESTNCSQSHITYVDLKNINSALTMSTASLNEQNALNDIVSKCPHSRSAENITTLELTGKLKLNSSDKDLNTEQILSDFSSHKNKVMAVQKIPEIPSNTSARYTHIHKEILSQDIGSIVKNVHGIFSSVSGSLKNAYTHRASVQKPTKPLKAVPNGKIMSDIFEDDNTDKIEKTNDSLENISNLNSDSISSENGEIESDAKKDVLRLQVETLERVLAEQRKENALLRERVKQQVDELQEKDHTFRDLESKLDLMGKRVEQAEREKDAAVMRYASVECARIEAKRAADLAAKNEKAATNEMELLKNKLRSAHAEKERICQLYDDKCHELLKSEREVAKVREDLRELEGRLKWTQSKLRMEMDAYKESSERAEKLSQQVTELEAAKEAAVVNATDSVRAKQLESDLKEAQAALILCRHEKEELERRLGAVTSQLDTCTKERDTAISSLARATAEVSRLQTSNMRLEEEAAELAALRAQAALADTLAAQLQRESARAAEAEEALSIQRALGETCARREAAALQHAAALTAQHVAHQAAAQRDHAQVQALTVDNASLREKITELETQCADLQRALAEETDRRNKENRVLARKVAELTEEVADANKKLEWEKGENGVLKKKHASAIKELNRELQRSLKRCEQLEAKLPPPDAPSTRTGSVSSLSSGESAAPEERLHNGHAEALPDIQIKYPSLFAKLFPKSRSPDRQALIERIVSLQRAAARRAERCEFLEEHARQLTHELRNKSRLLRSLLADLPAGALADQRQDHNKKEIARLGGGAMAALWGGDPGGLSADLSLEMNRRLQAVLEDTLLKNITLKENMDTLGAEISRLKEQNKNNAESK
ncbi:coiled-coil domain-containing protein 186 isoform X1 [Manduca sexta]|uniref:coiled-coil domain-containing protein 186 isoform X1 n=1 Tax=Manduca sexta TaxID=7130 RepID=UPI00188EE2C5|nr:coiled-coil domain-containing protein 186 isoform X1 [Manduca sexta]